MTIHWFRSAIRPWGVAFWLRRSAVILEGSPVLWLAGVPPLSSAFADLSPAIDDVASIYVLTDSTSDHPCGALRPVRSGPSPVRDRVIG